MQALKSRLTNSVFRNNATKGLTISSAEIAATVAYNDFSTDGVTENGTNTRINKNIGYVTENSGAQQLDSGTTSEVVTHGLDVTPAKEDIFITGQENPTNEIGNIYLTGVGATTFTVNVRNDPGTSNWSFGWRVISKY